MKHQLGEKQREYKFDVMIDEVLPKVFDPSIWAHIASFTPTQFIAMQQDIMQMLLSDLRLFSSFFRRFYLNHSQLHNWWALAKENQLEIHQYVFKNLLHKTYKEYRQSLQDEEAKQQYTRTNEVFRNQQKIRQKKKESFHKILIGKNKVSRRSPLSHQDQVLMKNGQNLREDYHELFIKTFNACDGNKYIYYDFDKHMKGMSDQKKYNNFIRVKKHTRVHHSMAFKDQEIWPNKENSCSTHSNTQIYFHEAEENWEQIKFSHYNLNPVGSVKTPAFPKDQYIIKKLPNVFRKLNKKHQSYKSLLAKKKNII